jgi:hypothetical protein
MWDKEEIWKNRLQFVKGGVKDRIGVARKKKGKK